MVSPIFRNYYRCAYDECTWIDVWDSECNDHCPTCDAEIEPYFSEELVPKNPIHEYVCDSRTEDLHWRDP